MHLLLYVWRSQFQYFTIKTLHNQRSGWGTNICDNTDMHSGGTYIFEFMSRESSYNIQLRRLVFIALSAPGRQTGHICEHLTSRPRCKKMLMVSGLFVCEVCDTFGLELCIIQAAPVINHLLRCL